MSPVDDVTAAPEPAASAPEPTANEPATLGVGDIEPPPRPSGVVGTVALVIDDLGRELGVLDDLASLEVPISYSVLPFETKTDQVVAALQGRREEILLHLPMQAVGDANPGPGALWETMTPTELATATRRALAAVPGAVGVNNHMGSLLSANRAAMQPVIAEIAAQGLFFLDSRTSAQSVGFDIAREMAVATGRRNVFLDGELDAEMIRKQFRRLLEIAERDGAAIAIGHPHAVTLTQLKSEVPRAQKLGYRFVPVSFVLERAAIDDV